MSAPSKPPSASELSNPPSPSAAPVCLDGAELAAPAACPRRFVRFEKMSMRLLIKVNVIRNIQTTMIVGMDKEIISAAIISGIFFSTRRPKSSRKSRYVKVQL
jgi:hypothetical protein